MQASSDLGSPPSLSPIPAVQEESTRLSPSRPLSSQDHTLVDSSVERRHLMSDDEETLAESVLVERRHLMSDDEETLAESVVDSMQSYCQDMTLIRDDDSDTDIEEGDFFSGSISPDEQQMRMLLERNQSVEQGEEAGQIACSIYI